MNTSYMRVLPRDLFNESKLLKCVGRLVLMIEDRMAPEGLRYEHDGSPFKISQDDSDGSISIDNVHFFKGKVRVFFMTSLNSRRPYPLLCEDFNFVFDDDGNFEEDFLSYINKIS